MPNESVIAVYQPRSPAHTPHAAAGPVTGGMTFAAAARLAEQRALPESQDAARQRIHRGRMAAKRAPDAAAKATRSIAEVNAELACMANVKCSHADAQAAEAMSFPVGTRPEVV